MNYTKTPVMLAVATIAALCALPALAQPVGWYGGGSIGRTDATIDDDRIRGGLAGQGLATSSIDERDDDKGYKVFGGYQLNRNFAVEAGFFDLGRFGYTATTVPGGTLTGDARVKGLNVDLVGTLPLTERFSALGRVGITSAKTESSFSSTGAARVPYLSANASQRSTNAKFGLGVAYKFTESLAMRVEAERYGFKDAVGNKGHADMLSVGLVYWFGAPSPAPRAAAPAPAPAPVVVTAAPPPAPVMVAPIVAQAPAPAPVAPAPVPLMRVSLSADSLFDFDRSTVKPAGRTSLDKLAGDLRGVRYDQIQVSGHTDRLGSSSYNTALSERRAVAVRDYLVQAGIPSGKVTTSGRGEGSPITQASDCRGATQTPALVTCLQRDRRVEVEVVGTR
ncbi:MAG: Outer membrane protein A precursor [uncultured Ramlibacter sp.]|uniref:Outer membrane protein A n=1 Tax=uncultured Ramlibacter sp. TaxID=260755 RepID=A0A6J4PDG7_9BURK|nr:MAG: Outer membrane protein A precursor [uncultured Ramlibacter sp.]